VGVALEQGCRYRSRLLRQSPVKPAAWRETNAIPVAVTMSVGAVCLQHRPHMDTPQNQPPSMKTP